MRILPVDIEGLDLVLGGGFSLLERVAGSGESTTILIRGPAGSGKTVVGTQFAASIARALKTDVAYGCVELLPAELRAQHESIRIVTDNEKVIILNEPEVGGTEPNCVRIYAGLLDLGDNGKAVEHLGSSLDLLLEAANKRAGRGVRVMVIDSLSDGYGLGARAPRILADGVSKLAAERGIVVILLEEQADEGTSVWGFSVDLIFELKPAKEGTPFERRLLIPKNRLGPSDPGPHEFAVLQRSGVQIYPRASAYQRKWSQEILQKKMPTHSMHQPWYPTDLGEVEGLPEFRHGTMSVVGYNYILVRRLALDLGSSFPVSVKDRVNDVFGPGIVLKVGSNGAGAWLDSVEARDYRELVELGWPLFQSGAIMISRLRKAIESEFSKKRVPLRLVIGDLRDMKRHADGNEMMQTIAVVASMSQQCGVPLILYETVAGPKTTPVAAANSDVILTCSSDESFFLGYNTTVRVDFGRVSRELTIPLMS